MARSGITEYDVLLSCPNDVVELKHIIQESIESFNNSLGKVNNIRLVLKHWSNSSFPQYGERPQEILNGQFAKDCDFCVALIGNRFGTPTGEYESGTEEEITLMIEQGKQVFLYFIEKHIDPSTIDTDQLNKVRNFRDKYKGLYKIVKSNEDLRTQLSNDLAIYFISNVTGLTVSSSENQPQLLICHESKKNEGDIHIQHSKFSQSRFMQQKFDIIESLLNKISEMRLECSELKQTYNLTKEDESRIGKMRVGEIQQAIVNQTMNAAALAAYHGHPIEYTEIEIRSSTKQTVLDFCSNHAIKINEDFFDLGNLQSEYQLPRAIFDREKSGLNGSESEKEKLRLIKELEEKIIDYNRNKEYFNSVDKLGFISLIIRNCGVTYDEDIDIKLYLPKESIVALEDVPNPHDGILQDIVEYAFPYTMFAGRQNAEIDEYSDYPMETPDFNYFPIIYDEERIRRLKEKYEKMIKRIFCYNVYETEDEEVLCFNISYLKQHTAMYFPAYLFFKILPEKISYKITSKRSTNEYKGQIRIIK